MSAWILGPGGPRKRWFKVLESLQDVMAFRAGALLSEYWPGNHVGLSRTEPAANPWWV